MTSGAKKSDDEDKGLSSLTLQPGQDITLTFSGVIALDHHDDENKGPTMVITPIAGQSYTIRLMGEGYKTYNVTATGP